MPVGEELSTCCSLEKQQFRQACDKSAKVFRNRIDMIGLVFYNAFIDGGAAMSSGRGRFSASV
jgi:hypothetical protein